MVRGLGGGWEERRKNSSFQRGGGGGKNSRKNRNISEIAACSRTHKTSRTFPLQMKCVYFPSLIRNLLRKCTLPLS